PLVSFKFTLVAIVHWFLFGYGLCVLQLNPQKYLERWFNFYTIPLLGILFFAWKNHAQYDFRMDASVLVARPFYFDHAILSASLLLLLGIYFSKIFIFFREKKTIFFTYIQPFLYAVIVFLLSVGVYLSFSRAAWVSVILASVIILGIVLFKFNFKLMLSISISGIILLGILTPSLIDTIQQNKIESKKGNWQQQISSVGNITTDASNLERLNRYSCAWRMFQDRPITGFGAGTFPTAFLPYQRKEEMTRISVTTVGSQRKGKGGSTHSEYLRALSEMGLLGGMLFLSLLLMSLRSGIRVFWKGNPSQQILALGLLFGLLTFFIHGLFNNFFHQGKIAILIWSSMAILVNLERRINIKQE
ncbi:O-antigen ligase family protein, partial [Saprospiraceae bacterium]|nr:O-antigen ligase family protein [Saprospiraceae bacterium]